MSTSTPASPVAILHKVDPVDSEQGSPDNIQHEAPLQLDIEAKATLIEPLVEEAPASLFTKPNFPVDEASTPLSEEVEYPINDDVEELDQNEADPGETAGEEEPAVPEDTAFVLEKASKAANSPENAMPLRATRRFQTVGNPEFKVVGVRPKRPSRFVTVGKDDFKTIKASITSMNDIYKASPEADDENDKEREETLAEEEETAGSPTYEGDESHATEPQESPAGSAADGDEKAEHPEDDVGAEEEEEFHTANDDSEKAPSEDKDVVTTEVAPKESAESSGLTTEAVAASHADTDRDAGPDL